MWMDKPFLLSFFLFFVFFCKGFVAATFKGSLQEKTERSEN